MTTRREQALAQYRWRAPFYDSELALFEPLREQAVARLDLHEGDHVLDLGCGTGLSLPLLRARVGASGRITAVEQCPEMLERAHQRVAEAGWRNIELICAPVEEAPFGRPADAALFHFTHDILQQPLALQRVAAGLRPRAWLVATGLVWASPLNPWAAFSNLFVLGAALHSVSSLAGLAKPWQGLLDLGCELELQLGLMGSVYTAAGQIARKT